MTDDLMSLFAMREEATDEERQTIDQAITDYIEALPAKVDSVRHVWKRIETFIAEAKAEMQYQAQRVRAGEADLERLKESCKAAMLLIDWPEGKPRKLEGRTGSISLRANGGKQPVVISDERMIPDEYTLKTLTLTPHLLQAILNAVADHPDHAYGSLLIKRIATEARESARVPSLSLIAEALAKPCERCLGTGKDPEDESETQDDFLCRECGGSGKQGVPGASLAPRGESVVCK
jgi:hypothetical protein